jgi:cystathionine gamma-lyase
MSKSSKYRFGTKAIHSGIEPDPATGAIMTPIYQTSTYVQSAPGQHKGYEYSRSQNPTRAALEKSIASLENAEHGLCYASGLAAIDAIIKTLRPGDEVVSTNDLYGGTYRIFTKIFQDFGIHFHFIGMQEADNIAQHITENTKLIWVETPTNPMMNIIDIKAIAEIAKKHNILLAVDNTFSTPYLQNPLELGADLVMHSVTKYISGHSDVIMGALATNNDKLAEKLKFIQNASGAVPGPQDCFLVLRGIKTLHLRMQRHCENGVAVANFLKSHPKVDKVFWPGFKSHPNHEIATRQMHDFGGMISFSLKENTKEAATEILKKFKLFTLAESLGGVESLSGHPASMTHASIPKAERDQIGLSDSLIRLSVGIEDIEDLIHDLKQALS